MPTELLTIKELTEKLHVTDRTIYNFRQEGMPVFSSKPLRFDFEKVLEWLKDRGTVKEDKK